MATSGDGTSATVEGRNTYDPYGKAVSLPTWSGSPVPVPYGFTGSRKDDSTGLYLMHHRWYDPETGRFIEQDPIGESGGLNVYAYVGSSPTMLVDPTGLWPRGFFPGNFGENTSHSRVDAGINSSVTHWDSGAGQLSQGMAEWLMNSVRMGNEAHASRIGRDASKLAGEMRSKAGELAAKKESMSGEDAKDVQAIIDQLLSMAEKLESLSKAARFGPEALKYETLKANGEDDGTSTDPCAGYTYSTCITVTETVNSAARDYWNKVTSYRKLKETYGWKPGDSMIISKYRPLKWFEESGYMLLFGQENDRNVAHEHMIWLKPNGEVLDRGYGPKGLATEDTVLDDSVFGEMTRLPEGVDPFETWADSGLFPPSDPKQVWGSPEDGWGLAIYNCQTAADWLHDQYR